MIRVQLREMKEKSGLSNKELAERSGISLPTVNRIMSGQTDIPNYQTVCDLVMAMGGSMDELAGIQRKPAPGQETSAEGYMAVIQDKNRIIGEKDRWIKRLFVISLALLALLLGILIYDYLHPMIGFIRT
ncbi:MAG: helix-turn-helix domain-containing protein [Oscillospiraceae bacterium]|jgi:transcriptional regulator with XRE-family HTH domain|nr:helix-turn-helix domain-containing protein [Oscillospiraceae bacterium]